MNSAHSSTLISSEPHNYYVDNKEVTNLITYEPGGSEPHSQGLSYNLHPPTNGNNCSYWHLFLYDSF